MKTYFLRKGIIQIGTGGNFSIFRGTGGRALRGAGEICHWGEGGNFIPSVRGGRGGVGVEKILPSQTEYYIFPLSGLYFECSPQWRPPSGYGINQMCPSLTIWNKAILGKWNSFQHVGGKIKKCWGGYFFFPSDTISAHRRARHSRILFIQCICTQQ